MHLALRRGLSVVHPCDRVADWELRLTAAAAQRPEKRLKLKMQSMVSTEGISLLHHHKVKKS